jgi:uncharacterized protein YndB with AHSA1/START domain
MSSWRQQALVDAPIEQVWELVGDPSRYPEWAGNVVEVTGLASVVRDAPFRQVTRVGPAKMATDFRIDELEEMRAITLRCEESGYYSRWVLTAARESTFLEAEVGIEPNTLQHRVVWGALGKRYLRLIVERSLDGLRRAVVQAGRQPAERAEGAGAAGGLAPR